MRTHVVGEGVALVLDPVRCVIEPDMIEAVADDVGAVVDEFAGLLLGFAEQLLAAVTDLVDGSTKTEPHIRHPPTAVRPSHEPRCCLGFGSL